MYHARKSKEYNVSRLIVTSINKPVFNMTCQFELEAEKDRNDFTSTIISRNDERRYDELPHLQSEKRSSMPVAGYRTRRDSMKPVAIVAKSRNKIKSHVVCDRDKYTAANSSSIISQWPHSVALAVIQNTCHA